MGSVTAVIAAIGVLCCSGSRALFVGNPLADGLSPLSQHREVALADESSGNSDDGDATEKFVSLTEGQLLHDLRNSTQLMSPWLLHEQSVFDVELQQDMREFGSDVGSLATVSQDFVQAVHVARCRANCLRLFDVHLGKLTSERGFLIPSTCGGSRKCQRCEQACEVPIEECSTRCTLGGAECRMACEFRQKSLGGTRHIGTTAAVAAATNSSAFADLRLDRPRAICLHYVESAVNGFLFKWALFNVSRRAYVPSSVPVVFVVEHRTRLEPNAEQPWKLLGTRSEGLVPIIVPAAGSFHQYRVTPVAYDGVLAPRLSHWTYASPEPGTFAAPREVRVVREVGRRRKVTATITLKHAAASAVDFGGGGGLPPSCHYSVSLLPISETARAHHIGRSEPYDLFQNDLDGLDFATNYTMVVRSTDSTGSVRSKFRYTRWFETPPCLETFAHNFSVCAPGPPSMLSVKEANQGLRVLWRPPPYTGPANRVLRYEVQIVKRVPIGQAKLTRPHRVTRSVSPSLNYVEVGGLDEDAEYDVHVRAVSEAGVGAPAEVRYFVRASYLMRNLLVAATVVFVASLVAIAVIQRYRDATQLAKRIDAVETLKNMNLSAGGSPSTYIPAQIEAQMREALRRRKLSLRSHTSSSSFLYGKVMPGIRVQLDNPLYRKQSKQRKPRDHLEIDFDDIRVGSLIGSGAFGAVYMVQVCKNGRKETLALKTLKENSPHEERETLAQEIEFLKLVGAHPHIVGLRGYCMMRDSIALLVEFCPLGDLKSYLDKTRRTIESKTDTRANVMASLAGKMTSYSRQIASGMEYLASRRLVHRDLAARNVLLESEEKVKITDFGLSRDTYGEGVYRKSAGGKLPIRWMALESLMHATYSQQSDVWSFGVLMWEMATLGEVPYCTVSNGDLVAYLKAGSRLQQPDTCSAELFDMMSSCWNVSPVNRPTFAVLKQRLDALLEQSQEYFNFESYVSSITGGSADSGVHSIDGGGGEDDDRRDSHSETAL